MKLEQNGVLRYVHFSEFLGEMANLGLIDFKIGLYIKVNVHNGQKNVKSISQNIGPSIGTK